MSIKEPEPTKLRDKAYVEFTRHLFERDVRPGQFVSQRELVALTGLPLGAIRELIPRLEAEGLIVTVPQRGMQIAREVDSTGRAICLTTTKEHAELKRDQIHAYGKDRLMAKCKGSMSASIEPEIGSA